MKAVLYARVSSEKQAEKDLSISAQLKALREYATKHGYEVVREFVDKAASARTADRHDFQEMISLAKSKNRPFDAILVWKLSRFARNREDSIVYKSLLRKRGIQVVSINENIDQSPAGVLLEAVIEAVDEFYSTNLSQDTKRGLKENALRGFCNGGTPPFGYKHKFIRDGSAKRRLLEIDRSSAPVVKRIFKLCQEGMGSKEIAKLLNDEGLRTRNGHPWSKWGILFMLKNPIYMGKYVYARQRRLNPGEERFVVVGKHKPIVSEADFNKVQATLRNRTPKNNHPRRITSDYLLSGLLFCEKCGGAMQGGSAKSGKFHYYGCYNHLRRGKSICDGKMVNRDEIERVVVQKLKERVLTPEHLSELLDLTNAEVKKKLSTNEERIQGLNAQIQKRQGKLDRLYEALESGDFEFADLAPRIKKLKAEIDDLQSKVNTLKLQQSTYPEIRPLSRPKLNAYLDDLYELLAKGTLFERKGFLRSFIKRISFDHPKVAVEYTLPLMKEPPLNSEVLSFVNQSGSNETSSSTGSRCKRQPNPFLTSD